LTANIEQDINNIVALIQDEIVYQQKAQAAKDWSRKYTLDIFETEIEKLIETK
jgi:hypothetical protein